MAKNFIAVLVLVLGLSFIGCERPGVQPKPKETPAAQPTPPANRTPANTPPATRPE